MLRMLRRERKLLSDFRAAVLSCGAYENWAAYTVGDRAVDCSQVIKTMPLRKLLGRGRVLLSRLALAFSLCAAPVAGPLAAQDLTLRQMDHTAWTAREGAPIGVNDIVSASDGTLWLATRGGLYRFDGLHFSIYLPPPGQPVLPAIDMKTLYMA